MYSRFWDHNGYLIRSWSVTGAAQQFTRGLVRGPCADDRLASRQTYASMMAAEWESEWQRSWPGIKSDAGEGTPPPIFRRGWNGSKSAWKRV